MTNNTSKISRDPRMTEVAYFLSKYGEPSGHSRGSNPPRELGDVNWNEAYAQFFNRLGDGRTKESFKNSLKNQRDTFDGHLPSGRQGWRQAGADRPAQVLSKRNQEAFDHFESMSRDEVWSMVKRYRSLGSEELNTQVKKDLSGEDAAKSDTKTKTEGGQRVYISYQAERNPGLRADALDYHGYACSVCGFDFGEAYGSWGEGYAEVHHLIPLGGDSSQERETDPKTDLAVVCANCHRMIHRRKGSVLTVEELRMKLRHSYDVLQNYK